jgi:hypothetical protein
MKSCNFSFWHVVAVLMMGAWDAPSVRAEGLVIPAEPQVLLKALPGPTVTGWKVTKSVGEGRFSSWLKTNATREFEKTALGKSDDPSNPPQTRLTIIDSGRLPSMTAVFHNFEPGEYEDFTVTNYERYPAVIIQGGAKGIMVKTLVDDRFVIELVLQGQDLGVVKQWMEGCDLDGLAKLPDVEADGVPEVVMNVIIDELNPERSRSYEVGIVTSEEIAQLVAGDNEELIKSGYTPSPDDDAPDEVDEDEGGDEADERPAKPGEVKPR